MLSVFYWHKAPTTEHNYVCLWVLYIFMILHIDVKQEEIMTSIGARVCLFFNIQSFTGTYFAVLFGSDWYFKEKKKYCLY